MIATGRAVLPVLATSGKSIVAVDLDEVARFVGISTTISAMLPPEILLNKWTHILESAKLSMFQFPANCLKQPIYPGSDRAIRDVSHHIFRIGESFLETAIKGVPVTLLHAAKELGEYEFNDPKDYASYADEVILGLQQWWNELQDRRLGTLVETYYGTHSLHHFLERSTWHSAQHTRQIHAVLEGLEIEPNSAFKPEDLAGLPMPERIWE